MDDYSDKIYSYKSDDNYEVGDIVYVPRGSHNEIVQAEIVSIEYCNKDEGPYPYDELKEIIDYADIDDIILNEEN